MRQNLKEYEKILKNTRESEKYPNASKRMRQNPTKFGKNPAKPAGIRNNPTKF